MPTTKNLTFLSERGPVTQDLVMAVYFAQVMLLLFSGSTASNIVEC